MNWAGLTGDVAVRVREGLARRRISRQQLAGARPFTLATLVRLEAVLQTSLRPTTSPPVGHQHAAADLGAYARESVGWLAGRYLTLRASFERPGVIYAYLIHIAWDEAAGCLGFRESGRLDAAFAQSGRVSLPHQSGQVYLITNDHGQFRLMTLGRPSISGEMYGLLSTLQLGRGGQLVPVATPIALVRADGAAEPALGQIDNGKLSYAEYRRHLDRIVDEGFARVIGDAGR